MSCILAIDDRPINRQFLVTLLRYGGHKVLEASGGEEARFDHHGYQDAEDGWL
jgi:CheY-like chemotaxis protein